MAACDYGDNVLKLGNNNLYRSNVRKYSV